MAVGEIGLDYFVPGLDAERQQRFYRAQLVLARRFDMPVIPHVRRSADQLLKVLRQVKVRGASPTLQRQPAAGPGVCCAGLRWGLAGGDVRPRPCNCAAWHRSCRWAAW